MEAAAVTAQKKDDDERLATPFMVSPLYANLAVHVL